MPSPPPATLQEALDQIARMDAAGTQLQNELAQAKQVIAASSSSSPAAPPVTVSPVVAVISHRAKIPSPTPFSGKIGASS